MKLSTPHLTKLFVLALSVILLFAQCSDEEIIEPKTEEISDPVISANATASAVACNTCNYVVPANKTTIDGKVLGFKPGYVICLSSAIAYEYITFTNIVGTATTPIIITNCGGTANVTGTGKPFVMKVANSKYFRVTGGNVTNGYGIKLRSSSSNGLVLGPLTTNFEVDHLEVYNVGFAGIMAKTEPSCDDATIRGNFTMRDVSFHHNYIHNTGGEGFYIGHTSYSGVNSTCGLRLPHTIEGVEITQNVVKASGWDAIQLSSATIGANISYNLVENYSTKNNSIQQSGICLGAGTGGVCHSNIIKGGYGPGIAVFGLADNLLYNNIITNAGTIGIFCDERTSPGKGYTFLNNTIINPKQDGIRIYSEKVPMNTFTNNIVVNPGSGVYIKKLSADVPLKAENNYLTKSLDEVKFVNPSGSNYRLATGSPAINKGKDISAFAIVKDHYKAARFKGSYYDIGASEFQQ